VSHSDPRMAAFRALDHTQQVEAIRRLAAAGQGAHTIAHATGLSVEQVRRILEETLRD
jgi:DNA invertase Pin-like site-specific DNA recombinase